MTFIRPTSESSIVVTSHSTIDHYNMLKIIYSVKPATVFKHIRLSKDGMTDALMKHHRIPPFSETMKETLFFIKNERTI